MVHKREVLGAGSACVRLLFFFALFMISRSITGPERAESNDLEQLQRYLSLTYLNENELFHDWTDCQNLLSRSYARNWKCAPAVSEKISDMNGTFFKWNRRSGGDHKPLLPDCQYEVSATHTYTSQGAFRFLIHQHECGFSQVLGGSSFQVISHLGHSQTHCAVHDFFNGTYGVSCPNVECEARRVLSRNNQTASKLARESPLICLNATVILDYEHFDAFSETKSSEPPMRLIISNVTSFCSPYDSNAGCPVKDHFWMHNYGTHDLSDYEWISNYTNDGSFPQNPTMLQCFANEKITFLVDGQLNMVSHYLEELYIDSNPQVGLDATSLPNQSSFLFALCSKIVISPIHFNLYIYILSNLW